MAWLADDRVYFRCRRIRPNVRMDSLRGMAADIAVQPTQVPINAVHVHVESGTKSSGMLIPIAHFYNLMSRFD